jgi:hypothetical protein
MSYIISQKVEFFCKNLKAYIHLISMDYLFSGMSGIAYGNNSSFSLQYDNDPSLERGPNK